MRAGAVVVAVRHGSGNSTEHVHRDGPAHFALSQAPILDTVTGTSVPTEVEAAAVIQRAALPRLVADRTSLRRKGLLERLELELELQRGLRLLLLCLMMFAVVIYASILESQAPVRRGILNTYKSLFELDDSLANIKTLDDLSEYLRMVSEKARLIQPVSSNYFVEETGELKILSGLRKFKGKEILEVRGLEPRVDSPSWSLMAWIQLDKGKGAQILRKPLGKTTNEAMLSCWSWYVGEPANRVDFGAHDFRGSSSTSELQEHVTGNGSAVADGLLHSVALVVTPFNVTFYMDGAETDSVQIQRPVTDCSGISLELGDLNIHTLGEVTFFARALTPVEQQEIMFAGFTLQAIAMGKQIYAPIQTAFDAASSTNAESFAAAQDARDTAAVASEIASVLLRQTTSLTINPPGNSAEPDIVVPARTSCRTITILGNDTSCHIMNLTEADSIMDSELGTTFFPLIKEEYMPIVHGIRLGLKNRTYLGLKGAKEYISYDPVTFPSFCDRSATFSFWYESSGVEAAYVLTRYKKDNAAWPLGEGLYWKLSVFKNFISWTFSGVRQRIFNSVLPLSFGNPLKDQLPGQRRHIVVTLNHVTDELCAYLDGIVIDCHELDAGSVGAMDCGMDDPTTSYFGLGHRLPGAFQPLTVIQDWRYYREALTADQIKQLSFNSADGAGNILRSCKMPAEGSDTAWKDINGHDCAWYQETKKTVPTICSTPEINHNCPIACQYASPCWMGRDVVAPSTYTIWNRVMYLSEESKGSGLVCVRDGVDAVAECRKFKENPSSFPAIPGAQDWLRFSQNPDVFVGDIALDDCDVLERHINPYCSFAAPWTQKINTEIRASGSYTIAFWWKTLEGTQIPASLASYKEPETIQRIIFFSKMAPLEVLAEVVLNNDRRVNLIMYGSCDVSHVENVEIDGGSPGHYENGKWYHTVITYGGVNEAGKRGIWSFDGSTGGFDFADFGWCRDKSMDFIQGMQLPGGVFMSPLEVTAAAIDPRKIQKNYYDKAPGFRVRRGPVIDDKTRMTEPILYERTQFPYAMSLVSPPILLQTRVGKSHVCNNNLGSAYQNKIWADTTNGVTCQLPYECDQDLLNTSTALMACSTSSTPSEFFGQTPLDLGGTLQFYEFLQSITDAPILVRNGVPQDTASFIDSQTRSITVAMVTFAPEYGLASTISITATLSTEVSVDFAVGHFQSLEGDQLENYKWVSYIGFILAVIIMLEKVVTIAHKDVRAEINGFMVDFIIQVFLPIVYFAIRLNQIVNSKASILETVGTEGLAGVPWASRSVTLGSKVGQFFDGLEKFEAKLSNERLMSTFYFVHATAALFRLIFQTSAHPRTAILVNTMIQAAGDLWHFVILFLVLNFGFVALGIAQFASEREEFSTPLRSFETLWEMLLGSMIESGDIPSSTWSYNALIMVYLIFYNFFIFMIMLNFIIAIIVEAYMKVVQSIADMEAEQEFFSDVSSVTYVSIKSLVLRWPGHMQLIKALTENRENICNYTTMRRMFPKWTRRSLMGFLKHYQCYDFTAITHDIEPSEKHDTIRQTVAEVEQRLSVLLGVPVPTMAERVMEGYRLSMIGDKERQARTNKSMRGGGKKKTRPDSSIGPSLVVKNSDYYNPPNRNNCSGGNMSNVITNAVDTRVVEEMKVEMSLQYAELSRQQAEMNQQQAESSRQQAEMNRRLEETMEMMRQLHAHSATAALRLPTESTGSIYHQNHDFWAANASPPALPPRFNTEYKGHTISANLAYKIASPHAPWTGSSPVHTALPHPVRTMESQPPLIQLDSENMNTSYGRLPEF